MQRGLMQFFKPRYWFTVRKALIEAGLAGSRAAESDNKAEEAGEEEKETRTVSSSGTSHRPALGGTQHYRRVRRETRPLLADKALKDNK